MVVATGFSRAATAAVCLISAAAMSTASETTTTTSTGPDEFDWSSIEPSTSLEYHPCGDDFQCARLILPLDWLNTSDPRTVTLAIRKLPALVPDDDPKFGGTIFSNPGGPGGSGTQFMLNWARDLRAVIDKPGERHYEMFSWDPRGTGHSEPRADCYGHDVLARDAWNIEARGTWGLDRGPGALHYNYALVDAFAQRCDAADQGDIMSFCTTPSVVRDMVEMLDKIEELRDSQAVYREEDEAQHELRKRNTGADDDDVARLQYIGFSYGTLLGNYFSSMYPGRVGRVVLDGVCDVDDYAHGPGWLTNLADADETFDNFLTSCHEVGPSKCVLANSSDASAQDLRDRVWGHIHSLDEIPAPIISSTGIGTSVVRGGDVRYASALLLYDPISYFGILAGILRSSLEGDNAPIIELLSASGEIPVLSDECRLSRNDSSKPVNNEALHAVLCGDGDDVSDRDISWWGDYVKELTSLSDIFGEVWAHLRFECAAWPFKPKWTFPGPFGTPEHDHRRVPDRPAAPLLFLSNRFDPVTPLGAARRMSEKHPGSAVVVQESMGHCAVASARSNCTSAILKEYFHHGKVPDEHETTCEANCGPWDEGCHVHDFPTASIDSHFFRRRQPLGVI